MPKKRLTFILLSLILLITGCAKSDTPTTEEVLEAVSPSVVMIYVEQSHGSGVIYADCDDRIKIATVAHLVAGYDQAIITMSGGETVFGNVEFYDKGKDIAIVSVEKQYLDAEFLKTIKMASVDLLEYESVTVEDSLILVGSAVSVSANATEGIIKSKDYFIPEFDENLLYIYGDAMAGMSGGGVFTKDGYLIGIIAAGSDASEILAIPITEYESLGGQKDD